MASSSAGHDRPDKRKSVHLYPDSRSKRPALTARHISDHIHDVLQQYTDFQNTRETAFRTWAKDDNKLRSRPPTLPPLIPVDIPDIPAMACPWGWRAYRGDRLVNWKKKDSTSTSNKTLETRGARFAPQRMIDKERKTVDTTSEWKTLEKLGDGTLRNIFRDTVAKLSLPATILSRLDQSFNCNQLWQEWCADIPDIDEFSGSLRADSFEVTCPPLRSRFLD